MSLPEVSTILYTTSMGDHTSPVFKYAVKLADSLNAKIVILHVVEPIGTMGSALIKNYVPDELIKQMHDEGINQIINEMQTRVERFCENQISDLANPISPNFEFAVVEGNHTDTILHEAQTRGADMIIMGAENTFGHHSSTTQQVVKQAKVPVVVVPTGKQLS